MPDVEGSNDTKEFCLDIPAKNTPFFLKGSTALDWGMQNRLARIFNRTSGRTVMLAIDHGYFQGPTSGLERVDLNIVPLIAFCRCADADPRHAADHHSFIRFQRELFCRASGGPSIFKELSNEQIAVDVEDALRLNVAAMAVQVFIGGEFETQSVHNMTRLVDIGNRYGIPVLGVTAVGKRHDAGCQVFPTGVQDLCGVGCSFRQDLLHSGRIRNRDCFVPCARRDGRREETPGTGGFDNGLQCRP